MQGLIGQDQRRQAIAAATAAAEATAAAAAATAAAQRPHQPFTHTAINPHRPKTPQHTCTYRHTTLFYPTQITCVDTCLAHLGAAQMRRSARCARKTPLTSSAPNTNTGHSRTKEGLQCWRCETACKGVRSNEALSLPRISLYHSLPCT